MTLRQILSRFLEETMGKKPLKKELIEILNDIVGMYVPSGHENELIAYAMTVLKKNGFEVKLDSARNVIASRGKLGDTDKLVCINAHTDTVQKEADSIVANVVFYDWIRDAFHTNGRAMIGGDDKCGVALALTLAAYTDLPMKIVLTSGEEIGSIGAEALDEKEFADVAFTFTVDRMHGDDLISEYCGLVLAPDTFVKKFIEMSSNIGVKFTETFGSYADTYVLCHYAPAVNLSSGYYNPHSKDDFILVDELYDVMRAVMNAITNKSDLMIAISQAPKDWQVDSYGVGTGFYEIPAYGGMGHYYGGTSARGRARGITNEYYGMTKKEFYNLSRKQRRLLKKKCKIDFGKIRGYDDRDPVHHKVPPHQESVDTLIEAYANGEIYDYEWDALLENGTLSKVEYHIGIDEKIARERYASAFETNGKGQQEEDEFYRNLSKTQPKYQYTSKTDFQVEEGEWGSKELREIGLFSGYLDGTTEDTIFVEYVTGQLSYQDLVSDLNSHFIDRMLFDTTVRARTEFIALMMPKKEKDKWVKVEPTLKNPPRISIRDQLASFGLLSGYSGGSIPDDIFVEYVHGDLPESDLTDYAVDGIITREFAETCRIARDEYRDLLDLADQHDRDEIDRERAFLRKKKGQTKQSKSLMIREREKLRKEREKAEECGDSDDCRECGN